nr:hypothetical protein [Candidatus Sigynarchaeota archaeon]
MYGHALELLQYYRTQFIARQGEVDVKDIDRLIAECKSKILEKGMEYVACNLKPLTSLFIL